MSWLKKIWEALFGKPINPPIPPVEPPPVLPVHPRNDKSKKCEWSEACGAPDVLNPAYKWTLAWEDEKDANEKPTGKGFWQFHYFGGVGLYKPHEWNPDGSIKGNNRLWLLPAANPTNGQPFKIEHIGKLEEVLPSGKVNLKGKATGYFGNRIIVRDAIVSVDGASLRCLDVYGQVVFLKTIANRKCRQE